jgi:hypothetical protein
VSEPLPIEVEVPEGPPISQDPDWTEEGIQPDSVLTVKTLMRGLSFWDKPVTPWETGLAESLTGYIKLDEHLRGWAL